MLSVLTAADATDLTTLPTVKLELAMTTGENDAWLKGQIAVASQTICNYLRVEQADNGTSTLGRETLVETIDRRGIQRAIAALNPFDGSRGAIILARRPVVSIASVTEDGSTVDPGDYQLLNAAAGKLRRLINGRPSAWPSSLIVITYTAGWILPGQSGRNLPQDIEDEAIAVVKASWFAKTRDPAVKSQTIPGVIETGYFFGTPGQSSARPAGISSRLDYYRDAVV